MKDSIITSVEARETLSDLMCTAVEVTVTTAGGKRGTALYAEGLSFGSHYGFTLYDGGSRYNGKGMASAAAHINYALAPALEGMDSLLQSAIDETIIAAMAQAGLPQAVNISSPVSFAVLKAAAAAYDLPLFEYVGGSFAGKIPVPGFFCTSGSNRYADKAEAMGKPFYAFVAYDFATHDEADYALWEVENQWEKLVPKEYGVRIHYTSSKAIPRGRTANDGELLASLAKAIKSAGFEGKVGLHADFSATAYYDPATGTYGGLFDGKAKNRKEMIKLCAELPKKYPVVVLQDPLEENDLEGYAEITSKTDIQVAGSDIFGTDLKRLDACAAMGCFNTAVLRAHKYATFSECAHAVSICNQNGVGVMPADSAGEGDAVVQYAVGFRCGSTCMSGLSSHGNKMSLTEREIGPRASFFGKYGLKGSRFQL
jgi:enolase